MVNIKLDDNFKYCPVILLFFKGQNNSVKLLNTLSLLRYLSVFNWILVSNTRTMLIVLQLTIMFISNSLFRLSDMSLCPQACGDVFISLVVSVQKEQRKMNWRVEHFYTF